MLKAGNITKGMFILFKGEPSQVLDKEFFNLGRGRGHLRAKLKNLRTDSLARHTFKSEEPVEEAELLTKNLQYLYQDEVGLHFMDPVSFDQIKLDRKRLGKLVNFFKEGESYPVIFFAGNPLNIRIPPKATLKVVQAEAGVKGDTVSGANKFVLLETGYKVKVPLFVKEGDEIVINTQTGEYVSRA